MSELECPKCPKCESAAKCFCKRGGRNGGFDEFFLVCKNCGHQESKKKRIGLPNALFGLFSDVYPSCPFCGENCRKHQAPPMKEKPKKKRKTRKAIDYKKIWEFPSLGKCDKSPTGNHRLKMVAYPNPEIWGDGIDQSEYDFRCIYCLGEFHVPYTELQKETEI